MPVDPMLVPLLQSIAASEPKPGVEPSLEQLRGFAQEGTSGAFRKWREPGPELPVVRDARIPGPNGDVPIGIYKPAADGPLPCHVYFHSGGWYMGDLDTVDGNCRSLAAGVPCVVVSVDYRLAPEHKFPVPLGDCYAALLWVAKNPDELGIDARRVSVGGGSAGGNLDVSQPSF